MEMKLLLLHTWPNRGILVISIKQALNLAFNWHLYRVEFLLHLFILVWMIFIMSESYVKHRHRGIHGAKKNHYPPANHCAIHL